MTEIESLQIEFAALVDECRPRLYAYAVRLAGGRDAGQDLLQDSLLTAWRFFDKYERGTNFAGWLSTIVKNQYINQYRRRKKQGHHIHFSSEAGKIILQTNGISERRYEEYFSDEVAAAFRRLPPMHQEILLLFDIEELDHWTIAQRLGINHITVRSRCKRARDLLQQLLLEYGEQHGYRPNNGRRKRSKRPYKNEKLK